jgi:cyclophilin family peptidyl-prolyl cis-trans isomerase
MVPNGIIQGGDPLTRDRDAAARFGTGGFHQGPDPEFSEIPFTAGTVATTLASGDPASGGSQFFVAAADQPQFTGRFTAFAHVVEGMDIVRAISMTPTGEGRAALERVEIREIAFRAIPDPELPPYSEATPEELESLSVVMETSYGDILIGLRPDLAPNHVRHFLRLSSMGVYDETAIHRVVPGFVIQAGDLNTRREPYPAAAAAYVVPITAEPSRQPHLRGTVSLARGADPDSGFTSFFIVLGEHPELDGVYTVFGEVLSGLETLDRISGVETEGERPLERVDVLSMRVEPRN